MKAFATFAVLLALFAAGVSVYCLSRTSPTPTAASEESTYDRIMRTGVIRCGYTPYSIGLTKNPNTGELNGIYKDVIEEAARRLNLKVAWVEEVAWGTQIEGLDANHYDLICSPVSVTAPRTRAADYTTPLYYSPIGVWVRSGDNRYTSPSQLDSAEVKIATLDGEQTEAIAKSFFPNAAIVSLPQNTDFSQLLLTVSSGKADVTFAEPYAVNEFMETNPGTLKNIATTQPLQLVPNIMLIPHGQFEFKAMMDNILNELILSGFMDRTIDKYEKYKGSYIRTKGYD